MGVLKIMDLHANSKYLIMLNKIKRDKDMINHFHNKKQKLAPKTYQTNELLKSQ